MAAEQNGEVPLSGEAQEAKELMQRELLRNMASKMMAAAIEEERQRRIAEQESLKKQGGQDDDAVRKNAYEQLMTVQEDLIRSLNLMKVKADSELEQAQRVTTEKKHAVHDELIRKSASKEADRMSEEERLRRIEESKGEYNTEKQKTYTKLVSVQEDLLRTIRTMKADEEMKKEQERRATETKKQAMQEQLVKSVGTKVADKDMEREKARRTEELTEEEYQRRVAIAHKMIDVQKQLLATHKPVQPIGGKVSQQVLEEAKAFIQEELRRKANQKEALAVMDEEQKRRIAANGAHQVSDAQAEMLEAINRQASVKKAKQMVEQTQQEYVQAEIKDRVQGDMIRKLNQKEANRAMDVEQSDRIHESSGKEKPHIDEGIKKELQSRAN